jgi:hypothetical protein
MICHPEDYRHEKVPIPEPGPNEILVKVEAVGICARGAFKYDVRCFLGIFDLPTYPNQILYYISIFSKIRCSLTYLPYLLKNLTSHVNAPQ